MKKTLTFILCCFMLIGTTGCNTFPPIRNYNLKNIAIEFEDRINSEYDVELSEHYYVSTALNARYIGRFMDKRDPSYVIQVCQNRDDTIEILFDEELFEARQELYAYIKDLKGKSFIKEFLQFYPYRQGGLIGSSSFGGGEIGYQIYVENLETLDEELETDYLIAKKAETIMREVLKSDFNGINVYYTNDKSLLKSDWIEKKDKNLELRDIRATLMYTDKYLFRYHTGGYRNTSGDKNNPEEYLYDVNTFIKCAKENEIKK